MYILNEVKLKLNRVCRLIVNKFRSNKEDSITKNKSSNNKNQVEPKLNRFGFPRIAKEKELNKQK